VKFQSIAPTRHTRMLAKISQALLKEFKKLKYELQCITELKEIKQVLPESIWDYDHRFNMLKDRLIF
jgi:hypothetical protein